MMAWLVDHDLNATVQGGLCALFFTKVTRLAPLILRCDTETKVVPHQTPGEGRWLRTKEVCGMGGPGCGCMSWGR